MIRTSEHGWVQTTLKLTGIFTPSLRSFFRHDLMSSPRSTRVVSQSIFVYILVQPHLNDLIVLVQGGSSCTVDMSAVTDYMSMYPL